MNTKTKSNLIVSILIAAVSLGLLALLAPFSNAMAGIAVLGALIGYGAMELKQAANTQLFVHGRSGRIRA